MSDLKWQIHESHTGNRSAIAETDKHILITHTVDDWNRAGKIVKWCISMQPDSLNILIEGQIEIKRIELIFDEHQAAMERAIYLGINEAEKAFREIQFHEELEEMISG